MFRFKAKVAFCCTLVFITVISVAAIKFPSLSGRVVDNAGLLDSNAEARVSNKLAQHEKETTNQVVVVTINSLKGYAIEEYGYQLGRHWGIGQKDKNNGALLIVAKNDRKVRIEVGYGLEGDLTDAVSANIIQYHILPEFKKGNFSSGIEGGVDSILAAIQGSYQLKDRKKSSNADDYIVYIILGIFIFSIFFGGSSGGRGRYSSRGYSSGGFGGSSGGGFSGGGGSFGGGGASGGW